MEETRAISYIKAIIWGILSGIIGIALLFILIAVVISKISVPLPSVPLMVSICGGIGGFLAGFISACLLKRQGILIGLLCGVLLCIIVLIGTLIMSANPFSGEALTKYAILLVTAMLGGAIGVNSNNTKRR